MSTERNADASPQDLPPLAFWGVALAIVAAAAALRFQSLDFGLPQIGTRPDEMPTVRAVVQTSRGNFDTGFSIYPYAYFYFHWIWGESALAIARLFGDIPPGSYAEVYQQNRPTVYWIGRILSATAGSLAVGALIAGTRRWLGQAAALAAGLVLATMFLHARDSHFLKPDALLSLTMLIGVLGMVPLSLHASRKNAILAGLAVGLAIATKYNAVILFAPLYVASLMGARDRSGVARWLPPEGIGAGAVAIAFFVGTSPLMFANPTSFGMIQQFLNAALPFSVATEAAGQVVDISGLDRPGPEEWAASKGIFGALWYHGAFSLRYGSGLLAALLAPVALVWGLVSRKPVTLLCSVLLIVHLALLSITDVMVARYMTAVLPLVALLEGGMLAAATQPLVARGPLLRWGVLVLLLCAIIAEPLHATLGHNRILGREDTRVLATRWLEQNAGEGARITILGTRFWRWGAPQVPPEIKTTKSQMLRYVPKRHPRYVMTHDHELFWSTIEPGSLEALGPIELLVEFDPFEGASGEALFERSDAYYVPFAGFTGVTRAGPHVRIYRLRPSGSRASAAPAAPRSQLRPNSQPSQKIE